MEATTSKALLIDFCAASIFGITGSTSITGVIGSTGITGIVDITGSTRGIGRGFRSPLLRKD